MISIRRKPREDVRTRFGRVQEVARQGTGAWRRRATDVAERIGPAAGERVMVARGWGAPRLRRAARYVEIGLAPRVSSFLSGVAHRVEPPQPQRPRRGALLAMLGAVAAVGVAGAVMTRRGAARDAASGGGDEDPAVSADSMTVSGADLDDQVRSPH
ncbi:hypothetical protein [Actinomadura roseirufa]|uniref:hypothetical protein n=1 Tax=Actinomadura roseirufa TaxID=2094049 RepID=UPI00104133DF|nr:hypothetical protein [Actinomadura roseirufa]